jgi:hypothetical protein
MIEQPISNRSVVFDIARKNLRIILVGDAKPPYGQRGGNK